MCCFTCTPSEHKVLTNKYNTNVHADAQCSVCSKVVRGNNCIHCTLCNHFVHSYCNNLSSGDIKKIEKVNSFWICSSCTSLTFPFANKFTSNEHELKYVMKCKSCQKLAENVDSKSGNCLKCNESLKCPICTKIV